MYVYILRDLITDDYRPYSTMSALSKKEKIPYSTIQNYLTRRGKDRFTTKDARIIIKAKLMRNRRK